MWTYQAPVADMLCLMDQVLGAPASWAQMPHFGGLDAGTAREGVAQAARFAGEVLAPSNAPSNAPGDLAGCLWSAEGVTTPPGYHAACQAFVDATRPTPPGGYGAAEWLQAAQFGRDWLLPQAQVHWGRGLWADAALPVLAA